MVQLRESKWGSDPVRNEFTYEYDFWLDHWNNELLGKLTNSSTGGSVELKYASKYEDYVRHLGQVDGLAGVTMSQGNLTNADVGKEFYFRVKARGEIPGILMKLPGLNPRNLG